MAALSIATFRTGLRFDSLVPPAILSLSVAIVAVLSGWVGGFLVAGSRDPWLLRLADLPAGISPIVAGAMLAALYGRDGWLHQAPVAFRPAGLALAAAFITLPLAVRLSQPFFESRQPELGASRLFGGTAVQRFWHWDRFRLTPHLGRSGATVFARSLGEFGAAVIIGGNLAGETQSLPLFAYQAAGDFQLAQSYAAAWILVIAAIAITALARLK